MTMNNVRLSLLELHTSTRRNLGRSRCHGAGGAVRTQVSKGSGRAGGRANGGWRAVGRMVGRAGAAARRHGACGSRSGGRRRESERERGIYSYGKIDRRLRGEERVPSTRPPLYGIDVVR